MVNKLFAAAKAETFMANPKNSRPPLGPDAKKNLAVFSLLIAIKTLALVVFAAVLGTAITYLARLTFAVFHEGATYASAVEAQHAVFAGNGRAEVEGIFFASPFVEPSVLSLALTGTLALIVRAAADWYLTYYAQKAATGAKTTLRRQVIRRVLATGGIDTPDGTGATAVLLSRGLDALDHYYTKTLTAFVSTAVIPSILLLVIAFYDWVSALIIVLTLPLIPVFMVLIGRTTREDTARAQKDLLRLSDHIVELVKGLPVLVGLGRSRAQSKALGELGERYRKATMYTLRSAFLSSLALELITTISIALVAVFIGLRLVEGDMGLDVALLALLLAPECYQPLRDVGTAYHQSEEGVAAQRRAQAIIDQPVPPPTVAPGGDYISVRDLSLSYPGRERVLTGVSFNLKHGTTTAITGPSGCGKSTLLGVLGDALRHGLVPTGTTEPIKVSGLVSGTGSTVWISQSPAFIAPTALAEVALYAAVTRGEGALEGIHYASTLLGETVAFTEEDREFFTSYLHAVGLADLADLPPEALSAGQMRRLAIARALARVATLQAENHRVTVLIDEPTAHLDPVSAAKVNVALAALQETGATLIIVTHDTQLAAATNNRLDATRRPHGVTWQLTSQNTIGLGGYALGTLAQAVTTGELEDSTPAAQAEEPSAPHRRRIPGIVSTLRTARKLTGIRAHQTLLPVFLSVLTVVFAVSLTALSGWLIVRAAEQPAMMYLLVAVSGVRFFGLGRAVSRYAERLKTHDLVLKAANALRIRAWDAAGRSVLSVRSLLRGDRVLDRLVGDVDELRDTAPRVLLPVASHLIVMGLVVLVTALATPIALLPVGLAVLIATFIIPAVVVRADARADAAARRETAGLLRLGVSAIDAAPDLHNNDLDQTVALALSRRDGLNVRSRIHSSRAIGVGQGLMVATWWGAALATIICVWPSVRDGGITAPTAAVVILMLTALFETTAAHVEAVRNWPAFAILVERTRGHLADVEADQGDQESEAQERQNMRDILGEPGVGRSQRSAHSTITLELESLATRWPDMQQPVFSGLSASVSSGEWLGITGPSGAGKTTALATLLGFLPLEEGEIRVNGQVFDAQALRGYAAWCPQSAYIFESTIANNLAIARPSEERPTEAEMYEVLDRVGLGDFVRQLPAGLQTPVGAGGSFVSGGQRQRIAIARTLLVDSPLLLMDEPTAHLDAPAAVALIDEVARGTKRTSANQPSGKTTLPAVVLVSHRAEDIAACDTVVKL
ncbi:thiol reductant ABC exporter subunit CydC [Rothia sp. (in: high G+C Gram-positive bacteria)]|uniref:thiol reductant ABC exporter subunit CydC n=1 Tax=Rothia sp. (in: high G+C Gram-positive bacteria) TaxID=1885016 RepID=UPI000EBC80EF|nr:thiol reductant ABC exporter subunit CydC [Rothia sp. (in: high G+C Gram-positive bacteria)]